MYKLFSDASGLTIGRNKQGLQISGGNKTVPQFVNQQNDFPTKLYGGTRHLDIYST